MDKAANPVDLRERALGGVVGLVVGDALGVPVQFLDREVVRQDPVRGMRADGRRPAGTWSDDASLALATAASLADNGYDPRDMMLRFQRWLLEGEYTPHGIAWDAGRTTSLSILRARAGAPLAKAGGRNERDNGNGSLMRILPLSLHAAALHPGEAIKRARETSALTHAHERARLCCAYHSLLVRGLVEGRGLRDAMAAASETLADEVPGKERKALRPILSGEILEWDEERVDTSGYVVHTLGASLWCLARHDDYREAVLAAVNLGGDADTTGAVTGGLAGVLYGRGAIPDEWVGALEARERVFEVAARFAGAVAGAPRGAEA